MDTKIFGRQQPGGYFYSKDAAQHLGRIWWVGSAVSGATDGAGYGQTPETPFATLGYLVNTFASPALASNDTVFILPGHTETLTGNPSLTLSVSGVQYVGLGGRKTRPTFLIDGAATAHIVVSGADTTVENICFLAGHADIAKAILVSADGVTIRGCKFMENVATENFLICILGGAANACDFLTVEGCEAVEPDALNTHFISLPSAEDRVNIVDNVLFGDWGTAAIGAGGVLTYGYVARNVIFNAASDNDSGINLAGSGICVHNHVMNAAAAANQITAAGWLKSFNYGVDSGGGDVQTIEEPVHT